MVAIAHLSNQSLLLLAGQGDRRPNENAQAVGAPLQLLLKLGSDRAEQFQTVMLAQDEEEVGEQVAGPAAKRGLDDLRLGLAADGGAVEELFQFRMAAENLVDERVQVLAYIRDLVLLLGGVEQCLGVDVAIRCVLTSTSKKSGSPCSGIPTPHRLLGGTLPRARSAKQGVALPRARSAKQGRAALFPAFSCSPLLCAAGSRDQTCCAADARDQTVSWHSHCASH